MTLPGLLLPLLPHKLLDLVLAYVGYHHRLVSCTPTSPGAWVVHAGKTVVVVERRDELGVPTLEIVEVQTRRTQAEWRLEAGVARLQVVPCRDYVIEWSTGGSALSCVTRPARDSS